MPKKPGSGKKKEKPKNPKVQIKELTDQNAQLTEELHMCKNEAEDMKSKITSVNQKILSGLDPETLKKSFEITPSTDPLLIPTDSLNGVLDKIIVKKKEYGESVEIRLEELESRVTDLNVSLAKSSKKAAAYETAFSDLIRCNDLEQLKDKICHLQFVAGNI